MYSPNIVQKYEIPIITLKRKKFVKLSQVRKRTVAVNVRIGCNNYSNVVNKLAEGKL